MHYGVVQTLCDVENVLELRKNQIFLGTLCANNFGYKTIKDCIRMSKGALIVIKKKRNAENIYKLIWNTAVCRVAVIESNHDCTVLWHIWFGHLGESRIVSHHKKGLLKGLNCCKLDFFKFYVLGK